MAAERKGGEEDQTQGLLSMNFAGMRRGEMEKSQRNVSLFRWIC